MFCVCVMTSVVTCYVSWDVLCVRDDLCGDLLCPAILVMIAGALERTRHQPSDREFFFKNHLTLEGVPSNGFDTWPL